MKNVRVKYAKYVEDVNKNRKKKKKNNNTESNFAMYVMYLHYDDVIVCIFILEHKETFLLLYITARKYFYQKQVMQDIKITYSHA